MNDAIKEGAGEHGGAEEGDREFEEIVPPLAPGLAPAPSEAALVTPPPQRLPAIVVTVLEVNGEQRTRGALVWLTPTDAETAIGAGQVRLASPDDLKIAGAPDSYET